MSRSPRIRPVHRCDRPGSRRRSAPARAQAFPGTRPRPPRRGVPARRQPRRGRLRGQAGTRAPFAVLLAHAPARVPASATARPSAGFGTPRRQRLAAGPAGPGPSRPGDVSTLHFLATFPALGPTPDHRDRSGPESTQARTSTPRVLTLLHEHRRHPTPVLRDRIWQAARRLARSAARRHHRDVDASTIRSRLSKPEVMLRFASTLDSRSGGWRRNAHNAAAAVRRQLPGTTTRRQETPAPRSRRTTTAYSVPALAGGHRLAARKTAAWPLIAGGRCQPSAAFRDLADAVACRSAGGQGAAKDGKGAGPCRLDRAQRVIDPPRRRRGAAASTGKELRAVRELRPVDSARVDEALPKA